MKKYSKIISGLLLCLFVITPNLSSAMRRGGGGSDDPAKDINYEYAFNQQKIYEKFKDYLIAIGCFNAFEGSHSDAARKQREDAVKAGVQKDEKEMKVFHGEKDHLLIDVKDPAAKAAITHKDRAAFEQACLARLRSARNWAITKPAQQGLMYITLFVLAAIVTTSMQGTESLGGSFSIFAALFNIVNLLPDTMESGYNYLFPPPHALNALEEQFALNKCYIPRAFWPKIVNKFMSGRQNAFMQQEAMEFLEFALGLTVYKPKPEIELTESKMMQTSKALHAEIDAYFKDYEFRDNQPLPKDPKAQEDGVSKDPLPKRNNTIDSFCWCLKINIDKFLQSFTDPKVCPRYIYLFGPGGIGKTYFIQKLCQLLERLIPGSVQFENMVITSAAELEGNASRPGAFLRILRNQLLNNKHASVIFMDEATWLNNPAMVDSAKRVFNGDQSKISTTYFGDGVEGIGTSLNMPPMLIFCAGNKAIEEKALASRFDMPHYPLPKRSALVAHALKKAQSSLTLKLAGIQPDAKTATQLDQWVTQNNIDNFRRAEAEVEGFLLRQDIECKEAKEKESVAKS